MAMANRPYVKNPCSAWVSVNSNLAKFDGHYCEPYRCIDPRVWEPSICRRVSENSCVIASSDVNPNWPCGSDYKRESKLIGIDADASRERGNVSNAGRTIEECAADKYATIERWIAAVRGYAKIAIQREDVIFEALW